MDRRQSLGERGHQAVEALHVLRGHAFDLDALHQAADDSVGGTNVVSICCDSDSARPAVTILALRRLASRTCHICQPSIPTRAADRKRAKAMVQLSQTERGT